MFSVNWRSFLTGYGQIVKRLASRVLEFGRPVLLLEGDSHDFKVDDPLAHGDPAYGVRTPVPNLTRIVVEGGPDQWTDRPWPSVCARSSV